MSNMTQHTRSIPADWLSPIWVTSWWREGPMELTAFADGDGYGMINAVEDVDGYRPAAELFHRDVDFGWEAYVVGGDGLDVREVMLRFRTPPERRCGRGSWRRPLLCVLRTRWRRGIVPCRR